MKFKPAILIFLLSAIFLVLFSYRFVDPNFPFQPSKVFTVNGVYGRLTAFLFLFLIAILFVSFGQILRTARGSLPNRSLWQLIFLVSVILFFAWPAFSYDLFSYLAWNKVLYFYHENPYLVMPIEFLGEPMLRYTHSTNLTAVYGPGWFLLTAIPFYLSLGKILLGVFSFKALTSVAYLGTAWIIWKISKKNKFSLAFFALNPLVLVETLVSGHNDILMVFFTLGAFYLLDRQKKMLGLLLLIFSITIKFMSVVLLPIYLLPRKINKEKIFLIAYFFLFAIILAMPLVREFYPWYLVWLVSFAALLPQQKFIQSLTLSLCLGTLLRYLPFLYTGSWAGPVPLIKKIVTFVPPALVTAYFLIRESPAILPKRK